MKQYTVVINGLEHTVQGTDEEVKVLFPDAKVVETRKVEDKAVKRAESKKA